jgi:8-oxo-dGTP pyrophosphatase MutT (NUDIX family)
MAYETAGSRQYRHPARKYLWELPAGLCDEPGEDPLDTARRELAEETGLTAEIWSTLVDLRPSSGISTEVCRVYHAERLTQGTAAANRGRGERSPVPVAAAGQPTHPGRPPADSQTAGPSATGGLR